MDANKLSELATRYNQLQLAAAWMIGAKLNPHASARVELMMHNKSINVFLEARELTQLMGAVMDRNLAILQQEGIDTSELMTQLDTAVQEVSAQQNRK